MKPLIIFLLVLALTLLIGSGFVTDGAFAKATPGKTGDRRFIEMPSPPKNSPEIGVEMHQSAAVETVVIWEGGFETPEGGPSKQGWTEHDVSGQIATYFHVDGPGCNGASAINGTKSMWCGQWSSTEDPWCGWETLPGYGNMWDQSLDATTAAATSVSYTIAWETETSYDFAYVEWYDSANGYWMPDWNVNGGMGSYDGVGGPQTEVATSPFGPTRVRFHFLSDGIWSDEDGDYPTVEGAVKVDDIAVNGGPVEDWEGEACDASQSLDRMWVARAAHFGLYAALHHGDDLVQEDSCFKQRSYLWGFFDDPEVTNYECGGWPLQGAVPYGPNEDGLYIKNEIWSPWLPVTVAGSQFLLQFLTYRDLPYENFVFFVWRVRTRDNDTGGCASGWKDANYMGWGSQKDWYRASYEFGAFVGPEDDEFQVALGVEDYCWYWCGPEVGNCHSHAPLFDDLRILRVGAFGPTWFVRDIDLWQDNFPELGGVGSTSYARCDMAQNILRSSSKNILPGDSLVVTVADAAGLAADNTGGRPGKAVYVFVRVTDRFGNPVAGKNGLAIQSPDNKAIGLDPSAGLLRWPFVAGVAPSGWDAYRMDYSYHHGSLWVINGYCADLMDLAAGPDGPPYHRHENYAANTGIFAPGDVIRYFFAAKNTLGRWSYWHRTLDGQGPRQRTNNVAEAMASPCEWSVLPDAGRQPGALGEILFVDDCDDRGGPAQLYFDWAFRALQKTDMIDRFDVLGPSSCVGNSLDSRVKSYQTQMINMYRTVIWNSGDLSVGLMGDGGVPNGGSGVEKSNDFRLCKYFLTNHSNEPGWVFWGDDAVSDWATLSGADAVAVNATYMNHTIAPGTGGDQSNVTGVTSPLVAAVALSPWDENGGAPPPPEQFFAHGGCPGINDFDMPIAQGTALTGHRYHGDANAPASVYQTTPNGASTVARFVLAGFGFNFVRDDDATPIPDYVRHLELTLRFTTSMIPDPIGIGPVAFVNRLDDNYPNPFNPTTTIKYSIAERGRVTLKIYNAAGELVRTLVDEEQTPHREGFVVTWDGTSNTGANVASGVYFCKFTAKGFSETKKMVVLK